MKDAKHERVNISAFIFKKKKENLHLVREIIMIEVTVGSITLRKGTRGLSGFLTFYFLIWNVVIMSMFPLCKVIKL